jgi:hypothetical protein
MLEAGSKQQRELSRRTQQLRDGITQLIRDYERETGVEVTSASYTTNDEAEITSSYVKVSVRVPDFID